VEDVKGGFAKSNEGEWKQPSFFPSCFKL